MINLTKLIRMTRNLISILKQMLQIVDRLRYLDSQVQGDLQLLLQSLDLQLYELRAELKRLCGIDKYGDKVGKLNPRIQPFKLLPYVRDFRIEFQGERPLIQEIWTDKKSKIQITLHSLYLKKIKRYIL